MNNINKGITKQQDKVLEKLVINLKTAKEVAQELSLSVHTVWDHRKNAYKRLGVTSEAEALVKLLDQWKSSEFFDIQSKEKLSIRELETITYLKNNTHLNQKEVAKLLYISEGALMSRIDSIKDKIWYNWRKKKMFVIWRWIHQARSGNTIF